LSPHRADRILGSLMAGAIGDALGAGIEFLRLSDIEELYGPAGATDFTPFYGHDAPITDDTQMTLFTAEGLLEAAANGTDPVEEVWAAYQRWYHTQGGPLPEGVETDFGLLAVADLHDSRAPGNTCMGALRGGVPGTTTEPVNRSKGCGGIMRVAPVGMVVDDDDEVYRIGCSVAALTHGHRCGWIPAGVQAVMVKHLIGGGNMEDAVAAGRSMADADPRGREVLEAVDSAIDLAHGAPLDGWDLEELGGAWVGEEALAIAVACVLAEPDPNRAMLLAVNHSGDSDSTGAIVGNLVGACHGADAISDDWRQRVEMADLISSTAGQVADLGG